MKRKIFRCAVFACILLISSLHKLSAQTDTMFWFAAPDLISVYDEPIYLRVTALNKNATVTISQPSNSAFTPIVQNVTAFSNYTFDLTDRLAMVENEGADIVTNQGILVTSTNKILAYYEPSFASNPDIFALKGDNALGTDFIIPSQKKWDSYSSDKSAFYVVATEDNTLITVTPSVDLVGHTKITGSFTKTLNKGQVYVARASSHLGPDHVGGTTVTSTKKVVITMANDVTAPPGGCGDVNGDQLVPTALAGQEFITLPGGLSINTISDLVYVYATQNNTIVMVNGINVDTINRAHYYELVNTGSNNYISTNKPALIYQVSGFGCETGGGVIPALTCTGSTTVGVTRASMEPMTLNILVKSGQEGTFTFNGSSSVITASSFSTVANTGGVWKSASISLNTSTLGAGSGATIKNVAPFHLAVINGSTMGGTRYGYFSGFGGFIPDVELDIINGLADMETDLDGTQYKWYRNGMVIPGATTKKYSTYAAGTYKVEVTYDANCPPVVSNELKVAIGLELDKSKLETRYCAGAHFKVDYTSNIKMKTGNIFKVQLSNSLGLFTMPTEIGTVSSTSQTGSVNCIIPANTPTAGQYRLRIIATDTAWVSDDNGFNIAISPLAAPDLTAGDPDSECEGRVEIKPSSLGSHIKLSGGSSGSSTAGYLSVPNTLSSTNDFTFETWIKLKSYDDWARILDFGNNSTVNFFFTPSAGGTGNKPRFAITVGGIAGEQRLNASSKIPLNKWTHVAVVINGTAGVGKMYMDGVEVASNNSMTLTPAKMPVTVNNYVGKSQYPDPYLNAELDEMRFWSVARTPQQIIESFTTRLPAGTPNLAAYFKFDEGGGGSAESDAPEGGSATLQNSASWVTPSESPSGAYDSYLWSNGDTTKTIALDTSTESGKYYVVVTKDVGCMATSDTVDVLIEPCCTYPSMGGSI
ncbi:MAG: hypothetical protein LW630_11285, partial [Saprospiraceae bacterium]|nr:hypothetical protein [Saprospiraceae bacterium]